MKIAVLRRGGVGDVICTAPLLYALFKKYPDAEITLFLEERGYEIAPYLIPRDLTSRVSFCLIGKGNKYFQVLKKALFHRGHFDLAISAKTTPMKLNDLFLRLLNAKVSMAVSDSKKISHPRPSQKSGHQALRALKIFDPSFQEIPTHFYPKIHSPEEKIQKEKISIDLPKPILLFSLSNRRKASQLHWQRFAKIANSLPFSVLINSISPSPAADALQRCLEVPSQILITPKIADLLRAIQGVDVVLTGDGGLCHIAAALFKPMVALYACTPLELWRPLGSAECLFDYNDVNQIDIERIRFALSRYI
jgi:ADP-heptose:LPS heptosyltransferase